VSADKATTYDAYLNWYLNENIELATNYDYTHFNLGNIGSDRRSEHALFSRVQFRFQ
jgi:phosphate-selective porin